MKILFIITLIFSFSVYSSEVDSHQEKLKDIDKLLDKAKAIDVNSDNKKGVVVKDVKPDSILDLLGLKSGDRIIEVNGKKVEKIDEEYYK